MRKRMTTRHTPAKMVKIQNTHRQDVPDTEMKPEMMGPIEGPAKGIREKSDICH
jgi:hypothetical protein